MRKSKPFNGTYDQDYLDRIAFPLGGIGAGMICLEGTGGLSHISLRHRPQIFNEPLVFSALWVKDVPDGARVLEGPVPGWKLFFPWGPGLMANSGNGGDGKSYGLPRFAQTTFLARFPFATVKLHDPSMPVSVVITGWSPFEPGNAEASSLPVAAIEYAFTNTSSRKIKAVYSFHASNFMAVESGRPSVEPIVTDSARGFVLREQGTDERPWDRGDFAALIPDRHVQVNHAWFRGSWFDSLTVLWDEIRGGKAVEQPPIAEGAPSPGASLATRFTLAPGAMTIVRLLLCWHVPCSDLRSGTGTGDSSPGASGCSSSSCCSGGTKAPDGYRPWYAARFDRVEALAAHWVERHISLRKSSEQFSDCFFDTTLPPELIEAVSANLTILKSPTVLRQHDGRLWAWEGCGDARGCCAGSCTHVWNYAQALPHLFPNLERTLRETEFHESQDGEGRQVYRACLPIRETAPKGPPAADGQLGGIMKVHREWRISGDSTWLGYIWPRVRQSMDFCIAYWDPRHTGILEEPQENTYDIEFWGPNGMCTSMYLGALKAAAAMGRAVGDDKGIYESLYENGRRRAESELFNGDYFRQNIRWKDLRASDPTQAESLSLAKLSREDAALISREGPKYQYGDGCLSDGVIGAWMAAVCGVGEILDRDKVERHLLSVYRYNFRSDLSRHANPQRPTFALGRESGLLLCTWPGADKPSLPFPYSDEVWTGIEYQVASHLMMLGHAKEGLQIVKACRRRYDGRVRNPFDEYECGHWYARAMASYALLQGMTGAWYDAVDCVLELKPCRKGDFKAFLSTATGYGTVGLRNGKPFIEMASGRIELKKIVYRGAHLDPNWTPAPAS